MRGGNRSGHVVSEDLRTHPSVDGIELGKGLNSNPEAHSPTDDGCCVIGKAGDCCAAGFIYKEKDRIAVHAGLGVVGGYELVDDGSPEEPD